MHQHAVIVTTAVVALATAAVLYAHRKTDQAATAAPGSALTPASNATAHMPGQVNPGASIETKALPDQPPAAGRVSASATVLQPAEQQVFANGTLNVARAESIVNDPTQFESVVRNLRDQYYTDPDATALAKAYQDQIAATLASSAHGIEVTNMACGLSVCAAEFASATKLAPMAFLDPIMNSGNDGGARLYSAVVGFGAPTRADPRQTYRLVFATDPAATQLRASSK